MRGFLRPEMVKGLSAVTGVEMSNADILTATRFAEEAMEKAISTPVQFNQIARELGEPLAYLAKFAAGNDQFLGEVHSWMQQVAQQINKDITLTGPVSTGLVPYDLEAPAKLLYPINSPLRNKIPRTKGQGTAVHYKQITQISGSNGVFTPFFMNELPAGNFTSLNLPTSISLTGSDKTTAYAFAGLGNNASLVAEIAGRGFQDVDALLNQTLLQSMMLNEEAAMLFARTTTLGTPSGLTVTAQAPTTGFSALTGVTTNVYVKVTALSGFGETVGSAAANAAPSGAQDVLAKWTAVPAAVGYNAYMSTGAADPGDASRHFAGTTSIPQIEIGGAVPTSGATVPLADTGTRQTNGYDGIITNIADNGGVVSTLDGALSAGAGEFQTVFQTLWNNIKANPDEILLSGSDRKQASDAFIAAGTNTPGAYRLSFTTNDQGHIAAGQVVASMWNKVTGKEIPLTVHPWLNQGTALIMSYQIPFPYSETPNVWENKMVQDYLGLSFPQIDLARRYAIIMYGALVCFAPGFNGILNGIKAV